MNGFHLYQTYIKLAIQKPKLKKYIFDIRKNLAEVLSISIEQISVKATTVDKLGSIGANQGWAAQAVVTISK